MQKKIQIQTDTGLKLDAIAPVIVSASRSTDIPTYFSKWFIERFKNGQGYVTWYNPFNQKPVYVSFKNTKVIVFWTKNPKPMLPLLQELDNAGVHYYFQYTLNDYYFEGFEPNVASVDSRIKTFQQLSSQIGSNRVVWRFDPILFTKTLTPREIAKRIFHISKKLKGYTSKLVISFIDVKAYRKVQNNLLKHSEFLASQYNKSTIFEVEPSVKQINEFCGYLSKMKAYWEERGWNLEISACAEGIDLTSYGITPNKCIDAELMLKAFGEDKELVNYLTRNSAAEETDLFSNTQENGKRVIVIKKDKGQRKECGCVESKDIGMYNTCLNGCIYCYANTSPQSAIKNFKLRKSLPNADSAESIWMPKQPEKNSSQ